MASPFNEHCDQSQKDGSVLSPNSQSAQSSHFTVDNRAGSSVVIRAYNVQAGQKIAVEQIDGAGQNLSIGPAFVGGVAVELKPDVTCLQITIPGRYRLNAIDIELGADMPTVFVNEIIG